ncbi:MAG: ATP-dependent RNA helicase HrpA [Pseudomonadales bacterium]
MEFSPEMLSELPALAGLAAGPDREAHCQAWRLAVAAALYSDRARLLRKLDRLCKEAKVDAGSALQLQADIEQSIRLAALRRACQGHVEFPAALPISTALDELRGALADNQVVVVAGETGSGKTTQLPKLCLEMGRGIFGRIGHTQPRRLAARTVAVRLAEELGSEVGELVGFQHRFAEQYAPVTRILVMTDGSLLAQLHRDAMLHEFDTLIIDEAHERSLNIDFLLGVVKRLLPRRPELKVIITSATIDVARFSTFFGDAPCVQVEGRGFPVATEYLPDILRAQQQAGAATGQAQDAAAPGEDINTALLQALEYIEQRGDASVLARDVLVFLPGEREIRDASVALRHSMTRLDVLPLYARLPLAEQQRIFNTVGGSARRRVVLATNVAETSLTVPGIGYVIDSGLARISRFSPRSKLQRLQVEPVAKASAAQRAGRAGRLAPGLCIRLYEQADFAARVDYTEPEILRTQLATVILQLKRLGLGELDQFPLLDAPPPAQLRAGLNTLQELGALAADGKLSAVGRQLSVLPLDPQLGRMLLAADSMRCVDDVLVIVSAMAVQDPREFPAERREAARMAHRRFASGRSDFIDWLRLWDYYAVLRDRLGKSALRKRLGKEFLSPSRMREWRDMHRQLRIALRTVGIAAKFRAHDASPDANPDAVSEDAFDPVAYEAIHRSLLRGIPLQVGMREQPQASRQAAEKRQAPRKSASRAGSYLAPRGLRFEIWPGSALAKRKPHWVLAAEIIETSRVYARGVAAIEPGWLADELRHLVKFEYGEPRWDSRRGRVVATRRTLLFGLALQTAKNLPYDKVDAARAREVFIQSALVEQNLCPDRALLSKARFWQHNLAVLGDARDYEARLRRRDLLPGDQALYSFYDAGIPAQVFDRVSLTRWLGRAGEAAQQALCLDLEKAIAQPLPLDALEQFPAQLQDGERHYALRYEFAPGEDADGVTVRLPLQDIARLPLIAFEWLVPGMLVDKVEELLKLLPKAERKKMLPLRSAAESACQLMARNGWLGRRSLYDALLEATEQLYRVESVASAWREQARKRLAPFYLMRAEVVDAGGKIIADGRDIAQLQRQCMQQLDRAASAMSEREQAVAAITRWDFGELGSAAGQARGDLAAAQRYLAETGRGELVLGFCASAEEARVHTQKALPALAMCALSDKVRYLRKNLCTDARKLLPYVQVGERSVLVDDVIRASIAHCCFDDFSAGPSSNADEFERSVAAGSAQVVATALTLEVQLYEVLQNYQQVCEQLGKKRALFAMQCGDVQQQVDALVYNGFVQATGLSRFEHLARYLEAAALRLDRLGGRVESDRKLCEKLSSLQRPLHDLLYKYPHAMVSDEHLRTFRWLLEELRVSLFAQQLKTIVPVSIQRVSKAWQDIDLNRYPLLRQA